MDTNIDDIANGVNVGPITQLPPEILELLFRENTNLFSVHRHNRLNTARSSSQVCQEWRETILSSPTLWGRLIDLDQLNFGKGDDQWRNEVISRSGSALLWIHGKINPTAYENIISFLDKNWTRIQRIEISEGDRTIFYSTPDITSWIGLERFAPHLQSFVVNYKGDPTRQSQTLDSNICLFKNGAPMLEELSVPGIRFDRSLSWLSNIRSITLSSAFSVPQIFQILKATPNLETLQIYSRLGRFSEISPSFEIYTNLPTISLPRLGRLILRTHFTTALPFLGRMNVPTRCIPFINMDEDISWNVELWAGGTGALAVQRKHEALEIIQGRVSTFLREYFKAHRMTHLSLDCRQDCFHISGHNDTDLSAAYSITIKGGPSIQCGPTILEDISLCKHISSVKDMAMYISALQPPFQYLLQIPSNLQSLTKVEMDEDTLKFLLANKEPGALPFPSLEVIKLTRLNPSFTGSRYPSIVIWDFFQWQVAGDSPVSVFDLTGLEYHEIYDMEYLDVVPCLKIVKWTWPEAGVMQYECGSGRPETLRFKQNWRSHLRRVAELRKAQQS